MKISKRIAIILMWFCTYLTHAQSSLNLPTQSTQLGPNTTLGLPQVKPIVSTGIIWVDNDIKEKDVYNALNSGNPSPTPISGTLPSTAACPSNTCAQISCTLVKIEGKTSGKCPHMDRCYLYGYNITVNLEGSPGAYTYSGSLTLWSHYGMGVHYKDCEYCPWKMKYSCYVFCQQLPSGVTGPICPSSLPST